MLACPAKFGLCVNPWTSTFYFKHYKWSEAINTESYEQRLAQRLKQMELAWQELLDGETKAEQVMLTHTHQLRGSAALYGYTQLGESALHLHTLLKEKSDFVATRNAWIAFKNQLQAIISEAQ